MNILSESEIVARLSTLEGWRFEGNHISKTFRFKSFRRAVSFVVYIGLISERLDHHAEIKNLYDTVYLKINTHVAGGVTMRDIEFARSVENI